jgi:hypothetical protein
MIVIDSNYEDPRMPFFQNPFTSDFEGYWVLADRQASLTFKCPRNAGRGIESVIAWMQGPYDLSSNDADGNPTNVLTLNFTISADYKSWTTVPLLIGATANIPVTFTGDGVGATASATVVSGVITAVTIPPGGGGFGYAPFVPASTDPATGLPDSGIPGSGIGTTASISEANTGSGATFSVTVSSSGTITACTVLTGGSGYDTANDILPAEIVGSLNNNPAFSDWFTASLQTFDKNPNGLTINDRIVIKQKLPSTKMRFYVSTGGAESQIKFNKLAGVAALPLYFARHTIANRYQFPDSQNALIQLGTTGEQANVIDNAVDFANNSLGYLHTAVPTDSALLRGRSGLFMVTNGSVSGTTIVYQAGAVVGDMAKKTVTSGGNIIEEPYTLTADDILVTP